MKFLQKLLLAALLACTPAFGAITFIDGTNTNSASSNDYTGTEPTGTAQNDLVIAFALVTSVDGAWTDPADFTQIDSVTRTVGTNDQHLYIGYKVRGATAGNGYNFTYSGTANNGGLTLCTYRGINTGAPLDVTYSQGSHYEAITDDITNANPAITTNTDGAFVILIQGAGGGVLTTSGQPSGYSNCSMTNSASRMMFVTHKEVPTFTTETPGVWTHTGGTTQDHGSFTIAIAPAATNPTFTSNPTESSCTDTGCTYNYTADASGDTLYAMFLHPNEATPTCDAIELGTGNNGTANESTTGSADSITITATDSPEFQYYDAHFCIEDGGGLDSSVVSIANSQLSAPTNFQFADITSIGSGSPCASFNTAVNPDIASPDYLLAPTNVSPGAVALTIAADCHFSYSDTGGGLEKAVDIFVHDDSAGGWHTSDIDFFDNNSAPICTEGLLDSIILHLYNAAITTIDLANICSDPDTESLTFTSTALPTGESLSSVGILSGTPTVENESGTAVTFTATDEAQDTDTVATTIYVVDTVTVPDITGGNITTGLTTISAARPWLAFGELFSWSYTCSNSEAAEEVLTQNPVASTEVAPTANLTASVSNGLCATGTSDECVGISGDLAFDIARDCTDPVILEERYWNSEMFEVIYVH